MPVSAAIEARASQRPRIAPSISCARKQALQGDVCRWVQLLGFASHEPSPLYENLRFFMASAFTARLLAQMVRTTMRTPTTNVTTGQRKQCRRTISSCVRCRSTSSGLQDSGEWERKKEGSTALAQQNSACNLEPNFLSSPKGTIITESEDLALAINTVL